MMKVYVFLDQRKNAKMDPNQSNVDNLNNVQRETSIRFRNRKKEDLKAKIDELDISNNNRGISDFKKVY
jgi:hypothetical protein